MCSTVWSMPWWPRPLDASAPIRQVHGSNRPSCQRVLCSTSHTYTDDVVGTTAKSTARATRNSRPLHFLARLGFAVSGLLHALIGVIAIGVATNPGAGEADQSGALGELASTPGGVFLLWVVVIGLTALGLWLLISAFLNPGLRGRKRVARTV